MNIFKRKSTYIFLFLGLICIIAVGGIIINKGSGKTNYCVETFYTYGENEIHTIEINTKNTDIIFESRDYDEGVFLLGSKDLHSNFDINQAGDCLYIKNKFENYPNYNKITFSLPLYFKNKVNFTINSEEGNIDFNGKVIVENIYCKVTGGNITGEYLGANKVSFKVDNNHGAFIKNIVANEEIIENI